MTKIGCFLFIIALNLTVGTWSVIQILSWFGKTIPLWGSVLIGLFIGEFSVPIAIVGWLLRICGVF
jgi:hypothetical protein